MIWAIWHFFELRYLLVGTFWTKPWHFFVLRTWHPCSHALFFILNPFLCVSVLPRGKELITLSSSEPLQILYFSVALFIHQPTLWESAGGDQSTHQPPRRLLLSRGGRRTPRKIADCGGRRAPDGGKVWGFAGRIFILSLII